MTANRELLAITCVCGTTFRGELNTPCTGCGQIDSATVTYPPSRADDEDDLPPRHYEPRFDTKGPT